MARLSPRARRERGVFYTPWEVAEAIVRQVDRRLKLDLHLPHGLADGSTWERFLRQGYKLPEGLKPTDLIVRILEPSAGSGVFLVAAIRQIYQNFSQRHIAEHLPPSSLTARWQAFVEEDLPDRLHAIELLSDAIPAARDTIGQFLETTGLNSTAAEFVSLHCGNALEPQIHSELAQPATVVIGNPPYAAASTNTGEWIKELLRGKIGGNQLYRSYFESDGQPLKERKLWLHDDYVKFLRISQWHLERAGLGVIGLVTNHGYLDNVTFRGLRFQLADQFDRIEILDLNGNSKKRGTSARLSRDESVFDIGQGVALSLFSNFPRSTQKAIHYGELWGPRSGKLRTMATDDWEVLTSQKLSPSPPHYFFTPRGVDISSEYQRGIPITDLIPQSTSTVVTARDAIVIDTDRERLLARIAEFRDIEIHDDALRAKYFPRPRSGKYPPGDTRGWKLTKARAALRDDAAWQERIIECAYRPFDRRWVYWSPEMIDWPRGEVMQSMQSADALALVVRRQMPPDRPCNFFLATDTLTIDGILRSDNRGNETLLPMVLHGQENLCREYLPKHLANVHVREVFAYLYSLFQMSEYRTHFAESLRIEYPRVFFPTTKAAFDELAHLGELLLSLHLRRSTTRKMTAPSDLPSVASGYPKWQDNRVWIDRETPLVKVDQAAWLFHIGSHQVLRKWLKDRRHTCLTTEEVANYLAIVDLIGQTQSIVAQIDLAIKKLGGLHRALGIEPIDSTT
ncbi:hypothetical protein C5Y97_17595 [Blastopirellula marina]|uniref:site-specific DNA-methyltransferase (adenine-specific) n=1 Tax=Blastopirellula marina TaxID=124 RepID=A0A2S8FPA5_9BACT|nr:hypothetical protein C5Y98_17585 [Blastopirellula marina]PTL43809.1 hypothetical protein C5Y97_17595 [Blastopirellula marina]